MIASVSAAAAHAMAQMLMTNDAIFMDLAPLLFFFSVYHTFADFARIFSKFPDFGCECGISRKFAGKFDYNH